MNILTSLEFDLPQISYGFFGRKGGVSAGIYKSLNAGLGSNDNPQNIIQNRKIIAAKLGAEKISNCYQIHSNICHVIDAPLHETLEGDALVTTQRGVAIGVLTADCAPVLFHAEMQNGFVIGAAHAGWGGALRGILESTLEKMVEQGAELENIKTMIGPCIGFESYEVSAEFLKPFLERDKNAEQFFKQTNIQQKFLFNLAGYVQFRLTQAGVKTIIQANKDTYALADDYFSFRRKTHLNEPDYGRQMSGIVIV